MIECGTIGLCVSACVVECPCCGVFGGGCGWLVGWLGCSLVVDGGVVVALLCSFGV